MLSKKPIIYRVMKRLENNTLVSPYAIPPFLEISMTEDNIPKTIPYGFGFSRFESAQKIIRNEYYTLETKFEIWEIDFEDFISLKSEYHAYQLYNKAGEYKDILSEKFFNQDFSKMPIKIGLFGAPPETVFCKNISLKEKLAQNY